MTARHGEAATKKAMHEKKFTTETARPPPQKPPPTQFAEFGIFLDQELFTLRPQRLGGKFSEVIDSIIPKFQSSI